MKQGIYQITENREIAEKTWRMTLEGDTSSFIRGGQFVDISVQGRFLRRPFAVQKWSEKHFSILYKVVGEGTREMTLLQPGEKLDILVGLGNGFDAAACEKKALVVAGGLGASPLFSLVKSLKDENKDVNLVLGFNKASEAILKDEYEAMGVRTTVVTVDGSMGLKGFVTDAIKSIDPEYDYFYSCGPKVMMKAVCEMLEGSGELSLEERMGCGCGICYGCTCHTNNGPKRICADGPVFKKEDVIW